MRLESSAIAFSCVALTGPMPLRSKSCSEPKSVADYRAMGLPAQEAIKGPGSVEYGMKWLQRRKIVIDRRRTPNAYNECVGYEYERNKDGDIISGYPDAHNHLIDATRYALEPVSRRMGVIA